MELILGWRKGEDKIRELLELFVFCLSIFNMTGEKEM
jgi:hypothetical protein